MKFQSVVFVAVNFVKHMGPHRFKSFNGDFSALIMLLPPASNNVVSPNIFSRYGYIQQRKTFQNILDLARASFRHVMYVTTHNYILKSITISRNIIDI